jgi:xylan 1,4-beta-xylosidase
VKIKLTNLDESFQYAKMFLVDDDHGSPLKLWETMGRPPFPSLQQQADLRTAAELAPPQTLKLVKNELLLSLQPSALAVIEFTSNLL